MVFFKYLFTICQSNLLHRDVDIQILEEQPARSGGGQEAEGALAAVPQPHAGVAALAPVLPLHADEAALSRSLHLPYGRAHAEAERSGSAPGTLLLSAAGPLPSAFWAL